MGFFDFFKKEERILYDDTKKKNDTLKESKVEHISCLSFAPLYDDGYVRSNKLRESICNITSLKTLILGSAVEQELMEYCLDELPKNIKNLTNLEELHLQFNNLTYLPPEIGELKKLKILKLGGNKLKTLPKEIGQLKQLELLTLWGNEIETLPIEIINLTNLKGFSIMGNPVEQNNKLTNKHIDWLINLKNNGCNLELSYSNIKQLKTNEIKYKVEYYKNNNISVNYLTIEQIESCLNYEIKKNMLSDKVNIYDGNNFFEKELSKKYNDFLNTHRIYDEDEEDEDEEDEYEEDEYEEDEYEEDEYEEDDDILNEYGIDYIYHMTHYKNLESILENGLLSHNNEFVDEHIDNVEVNDRRNKIEPIYNKNLHSYVPFYFNPKNPMLYVNKAIQDDIVILAFDRNLILKDKTIFTDGNASTDKTNYYEYLDDLDKLNWDCINANYWNDFNDGKRERMAEILVPEKVEIKYLEKIFCFDEETLSFILDLDDDLDVEINPKIYF